MVKLNSKLLFALVFTILAFFRFINLTNIPIFGDESVHLSLADKILSQPSSLFDSIKFGVFPIAIWIQALFHLVFGFLNPLWVGRAVSVSCDLLSAFFIYRISRQLTSQKAAIFSLVIYLLLPLNFLESRLALLESVANLFLVLALYYELKFISPRKPKIKKLIISSFFLILSFFSKPLVAVVFPAVILFPLFVYQFKNKKLLKFGGAATIAIGLVILLFYLPASKNFSRYLISNFSITQLLSHFKLNLYRTAWWSSTYLTLPILTIALASCLLYLQKSDRRILWLMFYLFSVLLIECLFGLNFYPRHLFLLAAPISLLIGYFFNYISKFSQKLSILIFLLSLIIPLTFDYQIITNPEAAPLALEDRLQLFEDWSSGAGDIEMAEKINQLSQNQKITLFVEDESSQTWVFQKLYPLKNTQIIPSNNLLMGSFLEPQLLNNVRDQKYYLLNKTQTKQDSWPGQLIFTVSKGPNRTMNLYSF